MMRFAVARRTAGAMLACLLALLCAGARAASTPVDYTDTWWNRAESGWGLQFVQQADVMFATLYVEDAQSDPIWYTAALRPAAGAWRGDLYVTRGPWFGGPFNPGAVVNRRVGDFAATFSSSDRATIVYSVDGVPVTKSIERYPLAVESLTGSYTLWLRATTANCTGVPPGAFAVPANGTITQGASSLQMTMTLAVGGSPLVCTYTGNYVQSGRYGQSDGTYTCGPNDSGTYELREMLVTSAVVTGRLTMRYSDGCTSGGPFGGYRE